MKTQLTFKKKSMFVHRKFFLRVWVVEGEEVNDFFVGRKMRVAEVRLILLF
jgi:hypothetical protein